MTKQKQPIWNFLERLPDGHRLFGITSITWIGSLPAANAEDERGLFAIADNSGREPQDTDDGILWLDFTRDLGAGAPNTGRDDSASPGIPLLDAQGERYSTITDTVTLLKLSVMFDWRINCLGTIMAVREA